MRIGGIQKFTLIDYPGKLACIVFTQGCVLRCKYCHNPELVNPKLFQKPIAETDILNFLKERVGKLNGVVISGGEPTVQPDLAKFMKKVKDLGYSIKLDTCGFFPEVIARLLNLKLIDYIAMDIKAPLSKYKDVVDVTTDQRRIKRSIELIMKSGVAYEFRTTVVKTLLSEKDLLKIVKSIKGASNYYIQKFRPSKVLDTQLSSSRQYSDDDYSRIYEMVKPYVFNCGVR